MYDLFTACCMITVRGFIAAEFFHSTETVLRLKNGSPWNLGIEGSSSFTKLMISVVLEYTWSCYIVPDVLHVGEDQQVQSAQYERNGQNPARHDDLRRFLRRISVRLDWHRFLSAGSFRFTLMPQGGRAQCCFYLYKVDCVHVPKRATKFGGQCMKACKAMIRESSSMCSWSTLYELHPQNSGKTLHQSPIHKVYPRNCDKTMRDRAIHSSLRRRGNDRLLEKRNVVLMWSGVDSDDKNREESFKMSVHWTF